MPARTDTGRRPSGFEGALGLPLPGNAVTNIRQTGSDNWPALIKPENGCLLSATYFCEYAPGKPAVSHWFAPDEDRPHFAFAGLWRP